LKGSSLRQENSWKSILPAVGGRPELLKKKPSKWPKANKWQKKLEASRPRPEWILTLINDLTNKLGDMNNLYKWPKMNKWMTRVKFHPTL